MVKLDFVYIALCTLTLSILLTLGFETIMLGHEPNLVYAPFSGVIALLFAGIGTTAGTALFYVFWWVHILFCIRIFSVYSTVKAIARVICGMVNILFKKQRSCWAINND